MAESGEEIVRRVAQIISHTESAEAAFAELDELMDPEIEYVNPDDAIERGTRKVRPGYGPSWRASSREPEAKRRSSLIS